ncbi:MAG: FecR domain-containing protein [Cytophagales bacterium]|nr:FecR domain-containing protein [Cytophagales bacterium]
MGYTNYRVEDFLEDDKFIEWILTNDPEINDFWESWIDGHPERKQALMDAKAILLNLDFKKHALTAEEKLELYNAIEAKTTHKDIQGAFEIFRHYMGDAQSGAAQSGETGSKSGSDQRPAEVTDTYRGSSKRSWYKVAALLIAIVSLAGIIGYILYTTSSEPETLMTKEIVKQNPKGQRLTTYLPDGSKVILNASSKLRYNSPFEGDRRMVELDGEAFFEVEKDTARPFIVAANGVTTTALGTSFNVNAKQEDRVEVALVSGKVRVTNSTMQSIVLIPGNFAVSSRLGDLVVRKFDQLEVVGWKDGILSFNESSFSEIIDKLEEWYGVDFKIDGGSINQVHYTSTYQNASLDEILKGVSFVYHFEYKISGDTVEIKYEYK